MWHGDKDDIVICISLKSGWTIYSFFPSCCYKIQIQINVGIQMCSDNYSDGEILNQMEDFIE